VNFVDIVQDQLGSGSFGKVHLCKRERDNKEFAIKVVKKRFSIDVEKIVGNLMQFNSYFLVQYIDIVEYEDNSCIVMLYFEEGDLSSAIRSHRLSKSYLSNYV
jgi:serine/threonine protein kinase